MRIKKLEKKDFLNKINIDNCIEIKLIELCKSQHSQRMNGGRRLK